jgi:hypothetical protein
VTKSSPVILGVLLTTFAASAQPATAPTTSPSTPRANKDIFPQRLQQNVNTTLLDAQRRSADSQRRMLESEPVGPTYKSSEVIRFSLIDGFLRADFGSAEFPANLQRFAVEGSGAIWMARSSAPGVPAAMRYVNLNRYDFDQTGEDQIWHTYLNFGDTYLTINAAGIGYSLTYNQINGMATLNAMKFQNGRYQSIVSLNAPSLTRLQAEHPREVHQYLLPLFRRWSMDELLRPGPADVYEAFEELPATSGARQAVDDLLPRLDSNNATERDAASAALTALGRDGIHAALRLNRSGLSFEQIDRLDAFIESGRRRARSENVDPMFLLDCMEDDDLAVRTLAGSRLAKTIGHPLGFDPAAAPSIRAAKLESLRATIVR